jgi:hypothetical protein
VVTIITTVGFIFGPLWYFNVTQPMEQMRQRIIKFEDTQKSTEKSLSEIDKRLTVMQAEYSIQYVNIKNSLKDINQELKRR